MLLTTLSFALSSCKKDPAPRPDAESIEFLGSNDTIYIKYNETLDVSTLFRIAPPRALGTLVYQIARQPDYREGADIETPYTTVTAYSLNGSMLTSIEGVRVPDAVAAPAGSPNTTSQRAVREGRLRVSLQDDASVEQLEIVIVQTDKPALVPVVTVRENALNTIIDGKVTRVLTNQGGATSFNSSAFSVEPMDLELNASGNSRIMLALVNAPYVTPFPFTFGGTGSETGTGGYILAYHNSMTEVEAKAEPETSTRVARLYINVIEADPEAQIVGIVLNEAVVSANTDVSVQFFQRIAPFTTNSSRGVSAFILAKLEDGTTREWGTASGSGGRDGTLIVGEYSEYMENGGGANGSNPGWGNTSVRLQFSPEAPVGTPVAFTIVRLPTSTTLVETAGPEWRVRVETQVIVNPAL